MHKFYSQVAHRRWQDFEPGMGKRRACASPSSTPALSNCSYENQNVVLGCNLKRQQDKRRQTDRYATVARIMVPLCVLTARTSSTGYSTTSVSSNVRSNPKSVILSAILADREWLVRSLIVKRQLAPVIMFNFQHVSTIFIFKVKVVDDIETLSDTSSVKPDPSAESCGTPGPLSGIFEASHVLRIIAPALEFSNLMKDEASNFRVIRFILRLCSPRTNWPCGFDEACASGRWYSHRVH